jgi:hypothetical protein
MPKNIGIQWEYRIVERVLPHNSEFDLVQYWEDHTITPAEITFYISYDALLLHYTKMSTAFTKSTIKIKRDV